MTQQYMVTQQIAKHLREVHFGHSWTGANLRDKLAEVTWQQATTQVYSFHTIATLVFHMNYYVSATLAALQGGALEAQDALSFSNSPPQSQADWQEMIDKTWDDAEKLACLLEQLPDSKLTEHFISEKNGTYFRCLEGVVEHCHYHLGQIALIKTILLRTDEPSA